MEPTYIRFKERMAVLLLLPLVMLSCNKDFEKRLSFDQQVDTSVHRSEETTKVLYVIVDGGIGKTMVEQSQKDDQFPYLYALTQTALFTGDAVTDVSSNPKTTHADMLTGVGVEKHQVQGTGSNNLEDYPSLFTVLESEYADWRTAAFTRSQFLYEELVKNADERQLLNSDVLVRDAVLKELDNPDASVILAQFQDVYQAGETEGYGPESPAYLQAIRALDANLGMFMEALERRPDYQRENWLIVLASNQGGPYALLPGEDDGTFFSDTERNSFVIFSNPRFAFQYIRKPDLRNPKYEGEYVHYNQGASGYGEILPQDAEIYNMGTQGDYTVQLKIKIDAGSRPESPGNPPIIAKSENTGNSTAGWSFLLTNSNREWRMQLQGRNRSSGIVLEDETWYTLTGKVYMVDGQRKIKVFTNGVASEESNISSNGSSDAPLRVGHSVTAWGSGASSHVITDVRIYNTALPDAYIQNNYCSTLVRKDDPYYKDLIGYWPAIASNARGVLEDMSPSARDFKLTDNLEWLPFSITDEHICPTLPDGIERSVPSTLDIPLFIYSWMGVKHIEEKGLDGKSWLPRYASN